MTPFPGNESISAYTNRMIIRKFPSRRKSRFGRKGNKLLADLNFSSRAQNKKPFPSMLSHGDRGGQSSGVCPNTGRYKLPGIEAISISKGNPTTTL
jgi:hypothetical protein